MAPRTLIAGAVITAALSLAIVAEGQTTISGPARVVDGDSLEVDGTRIRLFGVDAPELAQTCEFPGGSVWECGKSASITLREWLEGRTIRCEGLQSDRYGRTVATCALQPGDFDVGAEIVRAGMALEYTRYSDGRYATLEAEARAARRGMWATDFVPPWQWRREHQR